MELQQAAVDIGEDSKADARAPEMTKKEKKAPKPGYYKDDYYRAIATEMNVCINCCTWWMCYPDGYYVLLEMHNKRAARFPNSIATCWDCGIRL